LPGLSVLKEVMGSINLFGIVPVVGTMAVSAGVWAWGHHFGEHQAEANGKKDVLISPGAALVLGAANGIVGSSPHSERRSTDGLHLLLRRGFPRARRVLLVLPS
jgi:hypothetical protein